MKLYIIFRTLLTVFCMNMAFSIKHKGLNKHSPHIESRFMGSIKENMEVVVLKPPLFAADRDAPNVSGTICEYRLYPVGNESEDSIPFKVTVSNKNTGAAEMTLKPNFQLSNCTGKWEYNFEIAAFDCGVGNGRPKKQRKSHKSPVQVLVEDVNQHDPVFPTPIYNLDIEGDLKPSLPLVSLEVVDRDCSHRFSDICRYIVLEKEAEMFQVTKDGVLTSRRQIEATVDDQIFNVSLVAHDCGGRKSSPAVVMVKIKPACVSQWTGMSNRIELVSSRQSRTAIASSPALVTCVPDDAVTAAQVTVSLDTSDVASTTGCDRDTYALQDARKLCVDEDRRLLELLPTIGAYDNLIATYSFDSSTENTLPVLRRKVSEHGGRIFEFDGKDQSFALSDDHELTSTLNDLELTSTYSLSFRMFLDTNTSQQHEEKQTILCKSDGYGLSRHHFSVYVQHCHVMLLVRNDHGDKGELKPAEWHWKLSRDESCRGRWLRLLFNVNFPNATLFIDGEAQVPFLVADDYPLRSAPHGPKWVVGAAWEGRDSKFFQHFGGKLADLVFHVGYLEDVEILRCVDRCKEGIQLRNELSDETSHTVVQRQESSFESRLSLYANGSDVTELAAFLSKIVYLNIRRFPAPGPRRLKISTVIRCAADAMKCPFVPDVNTYIMVIPPPDPSITITGSGHVARPANGLTSSDGVLLFENLYIVTKVDDSVTSYDQDSEPIALVEHNLDSCVIEELSEGSKAGKFRVHPKHVLARHGLSMEKKQSGAVIRGVQTIGVYEQVLHAMTYSNKHAFDYDDIIFTLKCSELNGRFHSNTYQVEMTVLRPQVHLSPVDRANSPSSLHSAMPADRPAALVASQFSGPIKLHEADNSGQTRMLEADLEFGKRPDIATPAIIIGVFVVLVGLLVVVAIIHFRTGDDHEVIYDDEMPKGSGETNEEDLDWDDSAMTITVNPFEGGAAMTGASDDDVSDLEDDRVRAEQETLKQTPRGPRSTPVDGRRQNDVYEWDE